MENTETNYTTNKTLMDYYKANIDVQMNYLLFLNSFKSISDKGFLVVAPILDQIKKELYGAFEQDHLPDDSFGANKLVCDKIEELLDKYELSEVKAFIGYGLDENDIINLSTTIFIRDYISKIENHIELPDKCDTNEMKVITSTLNALKNTSIKTSIKINGYSDELTSFFLRDLGIIYDNKSCLEMYLYQAIYSINLIIKMIKRSALGCEEHDITTLKKEMYYYSSIRSNHCICNLMDVLVSNLEMINEKVENKGLFLEKKINMLKYSNKKDVEV